ncbi:MAG: Rid family hydrolase [Bryobacteraceae bacterium]
MRRCGFLVLAVLLAAAAYPLGKKKQKKEEETQVLELPRELPATVTAETRRLAFYVSPLSGKGLLSQQVRDALRAVTRAAGGSAIVKLRAFVAGTGDMRRVRDVVSETFTERRQPLPALSLVQVGALPLEGAQVVLEAAAVARKEVNPQGVVFLSGQAAESDGPLDPVAPLAEKSLAGLRTALAAAGAAPEGVLRLTCFLSSLDRWIDVRVKAATEYPRAVQNFVQVQRAPGRAVCNCEAVARLVRAPASPVEFRAVQKNGLSQASLVAAPRLVFTGTQASFGFQDSDARLAFERLEKSLEQAGTSLKRAVFVGLYPLSPSLAAQVLRVRADFFDAARPPAGTMLPFEGLPAMDAGFAVDAVAVKE